jgi:hypothetical protein
MKKEFSINGRKVGFNHSPLVIAEIGINHEGDIERLEFLSNRKCYAPLMTLFIMNIFLIYLFIQCIKTDKKNSIDAGECKKNQT